MLIVQYHAFLISPPQKPHQQQSPMSHQRDKTFTGHWDFLSLLTGYIVAISIVTIVTCQVVPIPVFGCVISSKFVRAVWEAMCL